MLIEDFIESKYNISLDLGIRTENKLKLLEEYYGSEIDNYIYNMFMKNPNYDFVNENLQSHDYRKLKEKLLNRFSEYIKEIKTFYNKDDKQEMLILITDFPSLLLNSKEFVNILDFYGYYYTSTRKINNTFYLYIEPKYSKKENDFIYNKCNGIVYHLTDIISANRILKSGLRIRNSKNGEISYRYFPKRIYVYADPYMDWELLESCSDEVLGIDFDKVVILKIDLNNSNLDFYKDVGIGNPNCYYTYCNIPKEWIKRIK